MPHKRFFSFVPLPAIKEALDTIQPSVETAQNEADTILDNMPQDEDKEELRRIMEQLHNEWTQLNRNYNDKHRLREGDVPSSEFTEQLNDLFAWLNETQNILSSSVHVADEEHLENLLEKVTDREEELSDRNDNLRSVNILGDKLVKQSSVNVDKKQIEDSLKKLNEHWNHVAASLPEKRKLLEDKLGRCRSFIEHLDTISVWVKSTKELLEKQQGPVGSATSTDEQDSMVVDPKTMEDALQVRQNNISQLNEMYFKLSDECKRREVLMPEPVSEKVETLNDDWLKIQELAATLRPLSDTSMEHNYLEERARAEVPQQSSQWPDFDSALAQCHESLTMMEQVLRSQIVTVGDIEEIEDTIKKQQANALQQHSKNKNNKEVLKTKGKRLY
ncbi:hypothetical protein LSH36_100g08015 [Paralvinella palmiformis]|uniref:Dystrophin n=1 Tax=Paralvinella palmiformis TaxID=53620 RepID=A0AAD9K001_9ANNE|nr:hypothetical protein LSH36_100g08015 [Paralvinella palmiformis]